MAAETLGTAAALATGAGPAVGQVDSPVKVTSKHVGAVRVGGTFRSLRRDGVVGALRQGCPLAVPTSAP